MIRQATADDFCRLTSSDPFMTRILSLYECYGEGYSFVAYWVQEDDGDITAAVSRYEDKFSLWLTDASDLEEITAFLTFQGAGSVLYNAAYELPVGGEFNSIGGQVLEYTTEGYNSDLELYQPEPKELYTLLQARESPTFRVPEYLFFLSDLRHREHRGKWHRLGIRIDDVFASSVMTVSETAGAVILGAVATHTDYRCRGLSRELVRTLATQMRQGDRRVYILSATEANTRFYIHSGFTVIADFKEIFFV